MPALTLPTLRRYAVARTLFAPTTLRRAVARLGFVQADPIRAPARAQDLVLRHRVRNYHAGDLERHYGSLGLDEDAFVNYGFMPHTLHALMHPRVPSTRWSAATKRRAEAVLAFVRERGSVHPRDVDLHFAHGSVRNAWGGSSNATTHLLDGMHYRGLLRVARRDGGIRVYEVRDAAAIDAAPECVANVDALIDAIVHIYAPVPATGLTRLVYLLRYGAPHLTARLPAALKRARQRLPHAVVDGIEWVWPAVEVPDACAATIDDEVRFLAPFDPIVWDRSRFERLWGWTYRFEAYVPEPKRTYGYYALPMLYRDQVIGWANIAVADGVLAARLGYAGRAPTSAQFKKKLEAEFARMRAFLRIPAPN